MSILTIAFPAQAAAPLASALLGTAAGLARPLIGLSAFIALLLIFKPLLIGVARAALLALKPRPSVERQAQRQARRDAAALHRLAKEADRYQPNLAAELRSLASRN